MSNLKRTSITLDEKTHQRGLRKAKQKGFQHSFSAYVAKLIEDDCKKK